MSDKQVKAILFSIFVFIIGLLASKWFSDNYEFEGNKLVNKNKKDDSKIAIDPIF